MDGKVFTFAGFSLDARQRLLFGSQGETVPLTGRAFDTLLYLVEHADELVDKQALMKAVWPNVIVEENNLNQNISTVRRALGEAPGEHRFIVTVPGRGFRFVALVQRGDARPAPVPERLASGAQESGGRPPMPPSPPFWRGQGVLWVSGAVLAVVLAYLGLGRLSIWRGAPATGAGTASQTMAPGAAAPVAASVFTPPPHSIAVLPFTNLSGDPGQEYFSDGLSEELINALSHIEALQVAARTSSFSFKGKAVDVGTIARTLGVGVILEGSIRRSGHTVRVTAQLVNAINGFHIWSENYDSDLKDVLALQTDIATKVAEQLRVKLLGDEAARIEVGGTHNPEAYDAYLRGLQLMANADHEPEFRAVLSALDQALELDPRFADAHSQRARALVAIAASSNQRNEPALEHLYRLARQSAERAVALAPSSADAHAVLGWYVQVRLRQYDQAARELDQAISLSPGSALVLTSYAGFQAIMGHGPIAVDAARRSVQLDPLSYQIRMNYARVLYLARRFNEAIQVAQEARALNPNDTSSILLTAEAYLALGSPERALQICKSASIPLEDEGRNYCLALAYHSIGRLHEATDAFNNLRASAGSSRSADYASIYAQWGEPKLALQWLVKAEQQRTQQIGALRSDWTWDPIRREPGFIALERRLNFPP
jgi:TolB-like protein/DNA-binding winged helix-turn-helix (wHTH) protein/Flp pilus assembly protein TadD